MSAAETYAARVDAVLAQRTRLRGPQPTGDQFGNLPPTSPLLRVDARQSSAPNLEIIASYVEPDDVIVDVGGGAGRFGLPLALRCREVVNVDPSAAMIAAFEANARDAGIANARAIQADWLDVDPPRGSLVLVKHVVYLTREIVPFIEKLEAAASRRVLITVNSPTPLEWHRGLFERIYGEVEESAPGHVELMNVLWEMGIEPDVRCSRCRRHSSRRCLTNRRPSSAASSSRAPTSGRPGQWPPSLKRASATCLKPSSTTCSCRRPRGICRAGSSSAARC